jgi:hypothetical protein
MLLRHATLRKYLPGIEKNGLLCGKSLGKLKVVWLHAPGKTAWALLHTVRRHGGRIEDVVVLEIDVPRGWLRKSRRGLWYSINDIPFGRMVRLIDFASAAEPCAA